VPRFGPKAVGLGRMMGAGLPVPEGFCIAGSAYREHVNANGLGDTTRKPAQWRKGIVEGVMPDGVREEIERQFHALGTGFVAVRSSATAEDLPDRSFAGQYDTVLGVADLLGCLDAVERCWASVWTDRAVKCRRRHKIKHASVQMAVIVQRLVPAEASGVIFTADPVRGDRQRLVIESTLGLGEPLVSGRVSPDRIVLDRAGLTIVKRHTSEKPVQSVLDPEEGVVERPVEAQRRRAPSLDDGVAVQLARLALQAEQVFGCPLDIEFAVAEGQVWLLQARPITALSEKEPERPEKAVAPPCPADRQVWTNANAGEVLPDVVTPMTWSIVKPLAERLLGQLFGKLGIDFARHPLLGLVAGRAYFNLNTLVACVRHIPGMNDDSVTRMLGGRQDVAARLGELDLGDDDIPDLAGSRLGVALRIPRMLREFVAFSPKRGEAVLERVTRQTDGLVRMPSRGLSVRQLAARARAIVTDVVRDAELLDTVGIASSFETALYGACEKWFADEGRARVSRMLMGMGHNANAASGPALWRLARLACEDPTVRSTVLDAPDFDATRARLAGNDSGRAFLAAWDGFMTEYGHHCRGEIELANARWAERPDHILGQLRHCIAQVGPDDFLSRYEALAPHRDAAIEEVRQRLRSPVRRLMLEFLLPRAQRCAPLRENLKSQVIRRLGVVRALLLEVGRHLTGSHVLDRPDDVFFLRLGELPALCDGEPQPATLGKITRRREQYEADLQAAPPAVVVGEWDPSAQEDVPPQTGDTLTGLGVNPGVVTGPARVILRAGTDHVRPGEVLVAPFTDPGWTPYFLNAAAIVMDLGGLLSHGSIIAREYGIPAVVNVGPATRLIRTGQRLQVDGTRGTVRILEGH